MLNTDLYRWLKKTMTLCSVSVITLKLKVTAISLFVGLSGTRNSITLNENLQPELRPTPATSQPIMQPMVQPPRGKCVNCRCWWNPTSVISHHMLNTHCLLLRLIHVFCIPHSAPLGSLLVQAAQMPWHFGNSHPLTFTILCHIFFERVWGHKYGC